MEGCRDRQQHRPLGAARLGDLNRALHSGLVARHDHLGRVIVIGGLANLALSGLGRDLHRRFKPHTQEHRHGTDADRHGLLHGPPAHAQQPRSIGQIQRARRAQGRVFPKAVARHELRLIQPHPFGLQRTKGGDRGRHQRGLGILRQGQLGNIAFPDEG